MDYPKKGRVGNETSNPFIPGQLWMPLLPPGVKFTHKNRSPIHFNPEGVDILDQNGPIHMLTLALDEDYELIPQSLSVTGDDTSGPQD